MKNKKLFGLTTIAILAMAATAPLFVTTSVTNINEDANTEVSVEEMVYTDEKSNTVTDGGTTMTYITSNTESVSDDENNGMVEFNYYFETDYNLKYNPVADIENEEAIGVGSTYEQFLVIATSVETHKNIINDTTSSSIELHYNATTENLTITFDTHGFSYEEDDVITFKLDDGLVEIEADYEITDNFKEGAIITVIFEDIIEGNYELSLEDTVSSNDLTSEMATFEIGDTNDEVIVSQSEVREDTSSSTKLENLPAGDISLYLVVGEIERKNNDDRGLQQ